MNTIPRSGPTGRHLRILLAAFLLVASSLSTALANQATPVLDGDTRVYVGHSASLIADILAT